MIDKLVKLNMFDSYILVEILVDELDLVKTPHLTKHMQTLLVKMNYPSLIVDIDKISYIDSMGISFLINLSKTIAANGKRMALLCKKSSILQVFEAVQIDKFLKVYSDLDDSILFINDNK